MKLPKNKKWYLLYLPAVLILPLIGNLFFSNEADLRKVPQAFLECNVEAYAYDPETGAFTVIQKQGKLLDGEQPNSQAFMELVEQAEANCGYQAQRLD